METAKSYIILLLVAASVVLGIATWSYRVKFLAADFALTTQNRAIEAQNREAESKLKDLTTERDAIQDAYRILQKTLLTNEKAYNDELEKMRSRPPVAGPVRVRVLPGSCGAGGDGAGGGKAEGASVSGGAQATSSGVLAPIVVGRVDAVAFAVEELQRDFNLCQTHLLGLK